MSVLAALAFSSLAAGADAPRPAAPNAQCLDARQVTQLRQIGPSALLVTTAVNASQDVLARFRIDLSEACDASAPGAALLAQHGWVCGLPREFVQSDEKLCAISAVSGISARDFAALSRDADQAGLAANGALMPAVESRGRIAAKREFRGSPEYCFRPSLMRSWSADGEGILVTTAKKMSGGFGLYRVEFTSSCPETAYLPALSWRSGVGLDVICGNPGDTALLSSINALPRPVFDAEEPSAANSPVMAVLNGATSGGPMSGLRGQRCQVGSVYPVDS